MPNNFFDGQLSTARRLCILAGYIGTAMISLLSLAPATLRPHTGAGGGYEHWVAYALVGLAFGLGYETFRKRAMTGLALSTGSAVLELLQSFVPGRNPEVIGFLSSSFGSFAGVSLAALTVFAFRALTGGARRRGEM